MYPVLFAMFAVMAFDFRATDGFKGAVAESETFVDRTESYGVGHLPVVGAAGAVRA
jgi:hypothetical protein